MRPCAVALSFIVGVVSGRAGASEGTTVYGVRMEVGAEYDSNPTRREKVTNLPSEPTVPSAALRLALAGDVERRATDALFLSLGGSVATRRLLQLDAEGEDLLISEARGAITYALAAGWMLSATGSYYDVVQRADSLEEARDFRSIVPGLRLYAPLGAGRLQLGGGWRWFHFKPAAMFDFSGPTASLGYRRASAVGLDGGAEWEVGVQGAIELRNFSRYPCSGTSDCPAGSLVLRKDRFLTVDADLTRTGDELVGGGVSLQRNDSQRFGESLWRLLVHLRLVVLLPLDLSLAARAELVGTRYSDAVPVGHNANTGTFVTIDDEGRSTLRLDLSYPLGGRLEAGARYTFYTHTPGSQTISFRRHLGLVYLALGLGR